MCHQVFSEEIHGPAHCTFVPDVCPPCARKDSLWWNAVIHMVGWSVGQAPREAEACDQCLQREADSR